MQRVKWEPVSADEAARVEMELAMRHGGGGKMLAIYRDESNALWRKTTLVGASGVSVEWEVAATFGNEEEE